MSQETLKKLRLIVPGVVSIVVSLPLFYKEFDLSALAQTLVSLEGLLYLVIVVVVGGVYYALDLREPFIRASLNRIHVNIKDWLLRPCLAEDSVKGAESRLREGRTLLNIFYHFVDNDESLKERAKNVRLNGLVWSSIADFQAIGLLGLAVYILGFEIVRRVHYLWMGLVLALGVLIANRVFMPLVTKKHIRLSTEQLEFLVQHYRNELCEKLKDTAAQLERPDDSAP